jgi:pyruvate formate lyase activating enzyme
MKSSPADTHRKGLVFNIQRFSVHDGPGIRTTVFMKGCPLKCLWCSNPESQISAPNLMLRNLNCRACAACAQVCPEEAIEVTVGDGRRIDWQKCSKCLECVDACLYQALNACGKYLDVEEILTEVMQDEDFYINSGGGLTVSGGEPLSQAEFVSKLLARSKDRGLHTVLDTTGHAHWDHIAAVLPFVDLILWDLKHIDPSEHKRTTGVDNALILGNLSRASELRPVWLRIPLIARFNDSEKHIRQVIQLGLRIGAEKISLLPYHEGAKSKCEQMGRTYLFEEGTAPSAEHTNYLKQLIEKEGLRAAIGN